MGFEDSLGGTMGQETAKICISQGEQPSKTHSMSLAQVRAVDEAELQERAIKAIDSSRNKRQATTLLSYIAQQLLERATALKKQSPWARTSLRSACDDEDDECFSS